MKIAFIGLGNMGGGMAANLVKAGHDVHAFDLSADALAKARQMAARPFASVREAVAGADAVVAMLPNGKIVESVFEERCHRPCADRGVPDSTAPLSMSHRARGIRLLPATGLCDGRCPCFGRHCGGEWRAR